MSGRIKRAMLLGLPLVLAALAIWAFAGQAQVIDAGPCEQECYGDHTACVDRCSEGEDPVECEGSCDDTLQDCLSECR